MTSILCCHGLLDFDNSHDSIHNLSHPLMLVSLYILDSIEELPKGESVVWWKELQVGGAKEAQEGGYAGWREGQAVGEGGTQELLAD